MVVWGDSFWSEGNRGFEVLSSNVKNGAVAIEEFQRFLNESVQCESAYCKSLTRLQSQLLKTQYVGTFTPIWNLIRELIEKMTATHNSTVNIYQDLLRDVHNYQEVYQKKFKTHIQKDSDISRSTELFSQLNNAFNTVNKSKEQYHSIALDYDRTKRSGNHALNNTSMSTSQDNASHSLTQSAINSITARQNERLEKKYRQAQDDYKSTIEKYNLLRNDYEKRFQDACNKFQGFEIEHIEKMLAYSLNYSDILQRNGEQIRLARNEFNDRLKSLTGSDLLDTFVEQKKTGTEPPSALQFEDIDSLKTTVQLTSPDLSNGQDDFNAFDQLDSNVPAFQAHFSVPPATTKYNDNNRALTPTPTSNQSLSPSNNTTTSPSTNINTTAGNIMTSNNIGNRTQEANSNNDQTSNPFNVKIRRPKFPGFFGSGRGDKKEKKTDKKSSVNPKSHKPFQKAHSREESTGDNSQPSNYDSNGFIVMTDKNDDSSKNRYSSPETYAQSNITNDTNHRHTQNTVPLARLSSSSSDWSDNDDVPMVNINVKINPKTEASINEHDDATLETAMKRINLNIGNLTTSSRISIHKTPEINKSMSTDQISKNIFFPPPLPPRPATAIPSTQTTTNIDTSNMFPPQGEFDRSPSSTMNTILPHHDIFYISSPSTTETKNTTSLSSTDDDPEVVNSFLNDELINKITPFPVLQVPSLHQSNQQASVSPSVSELMAPISLNFRNSPITSNEQGMSPITIGATDQIPLAIAFQETINVMMCGNNRENWKSLIVGEMLISFPSSMLNLSIDSSRFTNALEFKLKNLEKIENIIIKSSSITQNESTYSFNMTELNNTLHNLHEKTPSSRFFNLNVLNYEVKNSDLSHIPIEISSQWTRTFDTISVKINYRFNSSLLPESVRINNDTVIFYTIIADGQQIKESSPNAEWSINEQKLWWKVPYVNNGAGNLSATVVTVQAEIDENDNDQNEQPLTTSSIINAYFIGENALFSSIDFDLASRGYRVSLLKKKILSGKYQSEPDQSEPINLFKRPALSVDN
ncbi:unnamed protein product [Adineta steineri]|uniref:Uncharacterized protein n=1 Tax=Adineta steineri TaxID=433720 RepID=A0A813PWW6_9BILA|nr:unnamed protein product [Adineta steineri]CAF0812903.1 unnamed protein product [Adineta steineri]